MGERIDWIDIAKGMGIFLMVIGHTTLPHILSKTIYLFICLCFLCCLVHLL